MTAVNVEIAEGFEYLFDPPLGAVRYRGGHGGRGSAKSWQYARALLIHGVVAPLRILCAREWQNSIRDSVHKLLADQVEENGLAGNYDVQEASIIGANGTEFIFKGLRRDIMSIKSLEAIDICWIEEAATVSQRHWEVLDPTIRKPGSEIWATWNPELETDPTHQKFIINPPANAIIREHQYDENPWLPPVLAVQAAAMKVSDPDAYQHIWRGGTWSRSKAGIFSDKCVVASFTPQANWSGPYLGADFGFAVDPATLVKSWIFDRRLYIEYCEYGIKLSNDDLERMYDRVPGSKQYVIRADSSRPDTISEMRSRKFKIEAAPKGPGSVEDGIEHIRNAYDQVVIHPRCELAQQEAKLYRWKMDKLTDDPLPTPIDKHNHFWDAERYALAPLIRKRGINYTAKDFKTVKR